MSKKVNIVIGCLRDSHRIGLQVLGYALREEGLGIADVGPLAEQEDFIRAAIETNAKAILVSSSSGLGEIDCRGFRENCEEAGLGDILLYAGGNLVVGGQRRTWEDIERSFKDMGFNRAYSPDVDIEQVISDLKHDLKLPAEA